LPDLPPAAASQQSGNSTTGATTQTAAATLAGNVPIEYRSFARARLGKADALRLKGISLRGKWAVIYSGEDLSTGLVGQQVDGVYGYSPGTATEVVRRVILNTAPPP